jgi:uncharacterized protein YhfF
VALHGADLAFVPAPRARTLSAMSFGSIPDAVRPFWDAYLATLPADLARAAAARFYEAFHFDDNEPSCNELAALVLAGTKRATTGLLWLLETQEKPLPRAGDLNVVTAWDGTALCVIETSAVDVLAFEDVSAEFAAREGEGDASLDYWRRVHWDFLGRECRRIGRVPDLRMPCVCEEFRVVYR